MLAGELPDARVALVVMPDAPGAVVTAVGDAVAQAGGRVVAQVKVSDEVFDPNQAETVDQAVAELHPVGLTDGMSPATKVGWSLSRPSRPRPWPTGTPTRRPSGARSPRRVWSMSGRTSTRPLSSSSWSPRRRWCPRPLRTSPPRTSSFQLGIRQPGRHERPDPGSRRRTEQRRPGRHRRRRDPDDRGGVLGELSTVDVADLPSGVVTTALAGAEQILGRQGHYGALARADDALPNVPVR